MDEVQTRMVPPAYENNAFESILKCFQKDESFRGGIYVLTTKGIYFRSFATQNQLYKKVVEKDILPASKVTSCGGKIYIIGGKNEQGKPANQVSLFDPVENTFKMVAPMKVPRFGCHHVCCHHGKIYVVGGVTDGSVRERVYTSAFEVYTPESDSWESLPDFDFDTDFFKFVHILGAVDGVHDVTNALLGLMDDERRRSDYLMSYDLSVRSWSKVTRLSGEYKDYVNCFALGSCTLRIDDECAFHWCDHAERLRGKFRICTDDETMLGMVPDTKIIHFKGYLLIPIMQSNSAAVDRTELLKVVKLDDIFSNMRRGFDFHHILITFPWRVDRSDYVEYLDVPSLGVVAL